MPAVTESLFRRPRSETHFVAAAVAILAVSNALHEELRAKSGRSLPGGARSAARELRCDRREDRVTRREGFVFCTGGATEPVRAQRKRIAAASAGARSRTNELSSAAAETPTRLYTRAFSRRR
jgi:hypothetical protein